MIRLTWILLLVWSCAFAQSRPVAVSLETNQHCACHCQCNGSCGMPDCAPPPAPVQWIGEASSVAALPAPARKAVAIRRTPARFYAMFVGPAARLADLRTPVSWVPAASVPLFAEHCSFLL